MSALWRACRRFLETEDGPTAVEYAFMLALIIVVCVAAVLFMGQKTSGIYSAAAEGIPSTPS